MDASSSADASSATTSRHGLQLGPVVVGQSLDRRGQRDVEDVDLERVLISPWVVHRGSVPEAGAEGPPACRAGACHPDEAVILRADGL